MARGGRGRSMQMQNIIGMANGKGKGKGGQKPQFQKQQFQKPTKKPQFQKQQFQRPQFQRRQFQKVNVFQKPQFQKPQFQKPKFQKPQFQRPQFQRSQVFRPSEVRQVMNFMRSQKMFTARFNKVMGKRAPKGGSQNIDKKKLDQERMTKELDKIRDIDADRKVWVAGLGENASWKKVQEHFKSVGKGKVALMSKGKACIAFDSAGEASEAISTFNGSSFAGKPIEVDVWTQKEKTERKERVPGSKRNKKSMKIGFAAKVAAKMQGKKDAKKDAPMSKFWEKLKAMDADQKVKVTNVAEGVTGGALLKHFKEVGVECTVAALFDNTKGSACAGFNTAEDAESAIASVSGTDLNGKSLVITTWKREKKNKKASD